MSEGLKSFCKKIAIFLLLAQISYLCCPVIVQASQREFPLSGIVVDVYGLPVNQARVTLYSSTPRQNSTIFRTVTNTAGAYSFKRLLPGTWILEVEGSQRSIYSDSIHLTGNESAFPEVILRNNQEYQSTIPMMGAPQSSVKGIVVDEINAFLDGAVVVIGEDFSLCNESGFFSFSRLAAGNKKVKVVKSGYETLYSMVTLNRGENNLRLTLKKTPSFSTVRGRVKVRNWPPHKEYPPIKIIFGNQICMTDVHGRFTLKKIASGNHHLSLIYLKKEVHSDIVQVERSETACEILLDRLY